MSAAPYENYREYQRPTRRSRPVEREVDVQPVRVNSRRRAAGISTAQFFAWQAMLFFVLMGVTFGISVLTGSSMMEQARRQKVEAEARAKSAREDMMRLRTRMDRLTTMAAVDTWARSREFVPPHGLPKEWNENSVVAQLD